MPSSARRWCSRAISSLICSTRHGRVAADDGYGQPVAAAALLGHLLHGAQEGVDALERLDAAHEEHHALAGRHVDEGLGLQLADGAEAGQVDARRDHLDLLRVGAVHPDGLRLVQWAAGHDAVGEAQDGALGVQALLGGVFVRRLGHLVLHVAQRVEHLHDGDVTPGGLQLLRHQAGDPVVAVDHVVAAVVGGSELPHPGGEVGHVLDHGLLADLRLRAGWHVDDARADAQAVAEASVHTGPGSG
jgi:hypothetical protein